MARNTGELATDVYGINLDHGKIAMLTLTTAESAAAGAVHAAITGSTATASQVITTNITDPPYPRNIIVTPGGTTTDVKAGNITIAGTNIADNSITEALAFLANATGATTGAKAFKTVTSITVPTQDGGGATFTVTFGNKLGLPYMFTEKPFLWAKDDGVIEATAPTIVIDSDEVEKNTVELNTAMDGSVIEIMMVV